MVDRERILSRLDQLEGYLRELRQVVPSSFQDYQRVEVKRACERLLQISIESVNDICGLLVAGLRLGLPAEEDDLFEKLGDAGIVTLPIVLDVLTQKLGDFDAFRGVVLQVLRTEPSS